MGLAWQSTPSREVRAGSELSAAIGTRIRETRESYGWGQWHLARLAGTTGWSVSRVENGHNGFTIAMAERLAAVLGLALVSPSPWETATHYGRCSAVGCPQRYSPGDPVRPAEGAGYLCHRHRAPSQEEPCAPS